MPPADEQDRSSADCGALVEALGKRNLLWDLLLDALESNVLEVRHAE